MDEQIPQQTQTEQQNKTRRIIIVVVLILVFLLLVGFGLYFFMTRNEEKAPSGTPSFGTAGESTRPTSEGGAPIIGGESGGVSSTLDKEGEPIFRQLSQIPVSGFTSLTKDGKISVRYVSRENGHVFQVDPKTADSAEITNTTIPGIQEAFWMNKGNTVVLRYLAEDPVTQRDVIKTYLANLVLPVNGASGTLGSLRGDFLPDDVSQLSVAPNGMSLFYLLPVPDGVSGTTVTLATRAAKEVFRSTFSEWLPQLFNNGKVFLTTKPSSNIPGFVYSYDPKTKTLTRVIRDKKGLTALPEPRGTLVLYGENKGSNIALSVYNKKGFAGDEGITEYESSLPIATLPEKCAWADNSALLFCGSFDPSVRAILPDEWYQGTVALSDSFWKVNTNTNDITLIADPKLLIDKEFDVILPQLTPDNKYMLFVNKTDGTLWSMHIITSDDVEVATSKLPELSPQELKDYLGTVPVSASTKKPPVSSKK